MKKIYIVGIVGAGKTTFSKKLSEKLGIQHYEIDSLVHKKQKKGRVKQSVEEQILEFERINENSSWIIEGTYRLSCKYLLENADKIIFLDPPVKVRKYRIIKRFIKQQIGIEKCHYKSDIEMLRLMFKWTNDFEVNRTQFENMLEEYKEKLVVINKKCELKNFI